MNLTEGEFLLDNGSEVNMHLRPFAVAANGKNRHSAEPFRVTAGHALTRTGAEIGGIQAFAKNGAKKFFFPLTNR
jgi:hypothetical protein